jgi:hypothetical protein
MTVMTPAQRTPDPELAGWIAQLPVETQAVIMTGAPERGQRHEALNDVAHRGAEAGLSNTALCEVLDAACWYWGYYGDNTWGRWSKIIRLIALARTTFPNPEQIPKAER